MLHPAPTTKLDPTLTRATVLGVTEPTEVKPAYALLGFPNTDYKIHLEAGDDLDRFRDHTGQMVLCSVHITARRVDETSAGGRCIAPCMGTPRRVQGTVHAIDPGSNTLVVNAGPGFNVRLTLGAPGQRAEDFADAEFITCDVMPGAAARFRARYRAG